jgi:hypothetical protein
MPVKVTPVTRANERVKKLNAQLKDANKKIHIAEKKSFDLKSSLCAQLKTFFWAHP